MKLKMRHFPGGTALATAGIVATALAGIINPAAAVAAPPRLGGGITRHSYFSENLGSESGIMVYTPPQYDGRKPLPVLYLAPGACRDEYEWLTRTPGVNVETLDAVFESGEATPMIIVTLNSRVGSNIQGNPLQDPFPKERVETVVPFVDTHYKTIPSAQHRALAGRSCGGVQTLNTLLQYPGAFSEIGLWDTGWFAPIRASFSTHPALAADSRTRTLRTARSISKRASAAPAR